MIRMYSSFQEHYFLNKTTHHNQTKISQLNYNYIIKIDLTSKNEV